MSKFLLVLLCVLGVPMVAPADDYAATIATWKAGRLERLKAPAGWLALIGRHPLQVGPNTLGHADNNSVRLAAGPEYLGKLTVAPDGGLTFSAAYGIYATVADAKVTETTLTDDSKGDPTLLKIDALQLQVIDRNGAKFLRVHNAKNPARLNFPGINYFPLDPTWKIEARWEPFDPPKSVPVRNIIGGSSNEKIPGRAVFERNGQTYSLMPIQEEGDEPFFYVFSDATSGHETYLASRFLYSAAPKDGKVILDFNKAYNPPCAFTAFATCPLPPEENQLDLPITAGEKKPAEAHN